MPEDEREVNFRWKQYMLSYISPLQTEGVNRQFMRKIYLRRYVQRSMLVGSKLTYWLSVLAGTYQRTFHLWKSRKLLF